MIKLFCGLALVLLCSSCVHRTASGTRGLKVFGKSKGGVVIGEGSKDGVHHGRVSNTFWIWEKEFWENPGDSGKK